MLCSVSAGFQAGTSGGWWGLQSQVADGGWVTGGGGRKNGKQASICLNTRVTDTAVVVGGVGGHVADSGCCVLQNHLASWTREPCRELRSLEPEERKHRDRERERETENVEWWARSPSLFPSLALSPYESLFSCFQLLRNCTLCVVYEPRSGPPVKRSDPKAPSSPKPSSS